VEKERHKKKKKKKKSKGKRKKKIEKKVISQMNKPRDILMVVLCGSS
jgi:ribosomal protein L18